jgi:NADPH:quinone reductase-like Zn-dependent oxidoreductase
MHSHHSSTRTAAAAFIYQFFLCSGDFTATTRPLPQLAEGQVLVRVDACGQTAAQRRQRQQQQLSARMQGRNRRTLE